MATVIFQKGIWNPNKKSNTLKLNLNIFSLYLVVTLMQKNSQCWRDLWGEGSQVHAVFHHGNHGFISWQEPLHWRTDRYLINWIQVVYFKLKEIWPLFSIAKAKKKALFFFWMKVNLSQNLALKLAPNDNYFTEELVGILWIEFKLFISNWKLFGSYFPLLKPKKKRAHFLLPFRQNMKVWKQISVKRPWS